MAQQEEIDKRSSATGGSRFRAGPETKGATLTIAGKNIKLPDDAYWTGVAGSVDCAPAVPCAQTPIIGIARGKSGISVSTNTGQIAGEEIAPGEEGIFAFLEKELPPQVTGPRTRGATLRIAGRDLKLPDDAFVGAIIQEKDMVPGVNCVPPPKNQYQVLPECPKLPVYGIAVKKGAGIWISAPDGKVLNESPANTVAPGTFDAIKRQLP